MKRILILEREDLREQFKLKPIDEIEIDDLYDKIPALIDAELVIFYCSLLKQYKILKSRYGKIEGVSKLETPTDAEKLTLYILSR